MMEIKRGDIWYADLEPVVGSEQGGLRPIIILQNNVGNRYSATTIVTPLTGKTDKADLPTHVEISADFLDVKSIALLEHIRTNDR